MDVNNVNNDNKRQKMSKEKKEKKELKCENEYCDKKSKSVKTYKENPYDSELYGIKHPATLCKNCYKDLCDDI